MRPRVDCPTIGGLRRRAFPESFRATTPRELDEPMPARHDRAEKKKPQRPKSRSRSESSKSRATKSSKIPAKKAAVDRAPKKNDPGRDRNGARKSQKPVPVKGARPESAAKVQPKAAK